MKKIVKYLLAGLIGAAVVFIIFLTLLLLDKNNVPTYLGWISSDNSQLWLDRSMSYIGTVVGAFIGFMAAILTAKITNDRLDRARREDNAKAVLPLLKVFTVSEKGCIEDICVLISRIIGGQEEATGRWSLIMRIRNVGQRELYNLKITPIENDFFNGQSRGSDSMPVLYRDDDVVTKVIVMAKGPECGVIELDPNHSDTKQVDFWATYSDCYGNQYRQRLSMILTYSLINSHNANAIFYGTEVKDCKVVSAPELYA